MNESSNYDIAPQPSQPEQQQEQSGVLSKLWERAFWSERLSDTVRKAVENHLGASINLAFDAKTHFLLKSRIDMFFDGDAPRYVLGEIYPSIGTPLTIEETGFLKRIAGYGGSSKQKSEHNDTVRMLHEQETTFFVTDGDFTISPEQERTQNILNVAESVMRIVALEAIMLPTVISIAKDVKKDGLSRRSFLKGLIGVPAGATAVLANPRGIANWLSRQLESNPDFLPYAEGLMTFRNYIMVHASWNVLQRIAVADSAAPTLFHIANGHNKRDGEGCSDLFIKGPEHTENKVKAYAQRLVDSMLEFHRSNEIGDSPESGHVKDALFSMLAQHFCLPYQIGPDLPEGKIPAQEFKVPLVLLLEELGARITGNTTSEEKAALSRVVCRVIRNVSENYAALRQFQKPFISLEKAQVDEMKQSFWLDAPVFSDTSHGTSPRVGFRIDPAIITEINDEYLTSFRFFGNKYKFQYCGFAIQDGLPYPLLEVLSKPGLSVDTDNPHAGKLFAEMRDGTLKEVTQ